MARAFATVGHCDQARRFLNRLASSLARADSDAVIHGQDKDLAVTDLAALTTFGDGRNGRVNELFVDRDLQLQFRQQIQSDLLTRQLVNLPALSPKALAIQDGQTNDFDLAKRFFD